MPEVVYRPDFAKRGGLLPAVVQNVHNGDILMVGWVSPEAWDRTFATGHATFWSTSRQELWEKGATSGDRLRIVEVRVDCDDDAILYRVDPTGAGACHTRNASGRTRSSCFFRRVEAGVITDLDP